ncbi:MAG: bifunctional (p)ppGpp synthetase/guanosine-3',5'-bis(diphosphate) 3'-pyrophosphohydrolase [candidate division Zixibacteria bacterium]|nr:bifunctional (p)ppGpp synthetase/guanosine-3',5'-bis(diphosphate) 3'-pyrophosphohydrolase [candidate division Zixibacteria bacterium]
MAVKTKMNLAQFIIYIEAFNANIDIPLIRKAYEFSDKAHDGQFRESGDHYIEHCLETAFILAEQHMDSTTIAAGLIHDVVEDTPTTIEQVEKEFGPEIAHLVKGLTKLYGLKYKSTTAKQVEYFRKMLLSMSEDIRVIIIKLADRLHNMRTIAPLSDYKKERVALETKEIYAPLAHRLGMGKIKYELEDLSFKVLYPDEYTSLEHKVKQSQEEREQYINEVVSPLRKAIEKDNIAAEISGRAKHLYSIWRKMKNRQVGFRQIYDLFAIRAIVETEQDCYHTLGIVHTLWKPVAERFDDYIGNPKSNMYQSLHTTVVGPRGKMVEIQIRTQSMHYRAENGIAAHWLYKEGKRTYDESDKRLTWVRELLEWQKELTDPDEFLEYFKIDLFKDDIFVYTPIGELIHLQKEATPLDYAFAIHTDVGFHCTGAKVNGKLVPLITSLHSGDEVEIITSSHQHPSVDWLNIVKTPKAKSKIKNWLQQQGYQQAVSLGWEMFERELKRERMKTPSDQQLLEAANEKGFSDIDLMMARLSAGAISLKSILNLIEPEKPEKDISFFEKLKERTRRQPKGISIKGADNLMFRFAKCCQPLPGENIIGFITRGRGITVHSSNCPNAAAITDTDRKIEVLWDVEKGQNFLIQLEALVYDRKNLLREITDTIAETDINVRGAEIKAEGNIADSKPTMGYFLLEVSNLAKLRMAMSKIKKITGVISVHRTRSTARDE